MIIPAFVSIAAIIATPAWSVCCLPSDSAFAISTAAVPTEQAASAQATQDQPAPVIGPTASSDTVPSTGPVSTSPLAAGPAADGDVPQPQAEGEKPVAEATSQNAEDIVVVGRNRRGDPLAGVNEKSFAAMQAVDDAVVAPLARAYAKVVPRPIRMGLRNFLANLREPIVAINFLLQLKVGKAAETLARMGVNTTIGAAGLFDVAAKRPFKLPRRQNGLGNTLGFYGVKPGPFLFLPLIGPTTVRDLLGNGFDQALIPATTVAPFNDRIVTIPLLNLGALDYRNEIDEDQRRIRASRDPYAAARKHYLERRQAEIDALRKPRRATSGPKPAATFSR